MSNFACIVDYDSLYSKEYFAHAPGVSSFDANYLPLLVARDASNYGNRVVDIGGGNWLLGKELSSHGVRAFTLDAAERTAPNYICVDLSHFDASATEEIRNRLSSELGEDWFAICLDVAEHIDVEHLADFLLNLRTFIVKAGVMSISTRPSSRGNRFHSCLLPISTWIRLLQLAGFAITRHDTLDTHRDEHVFSGASEELIAVSHWQRINPFRCDHTSHQHYLAITRIDEATFDPAGFRDRVAEIADIAYRQEKRVSLHSDTPRLIYNVNFIQDWSYLRSLMDVWPADRLCIIIRGDLIATSYLHLIKNYCIRVGVRHTVISNVGQGTSFLECLGDLKGSLFVTATEGIRWPTHLINSVLVLEARRRGAKTICLQHGMNVPQTVAPGSALLGAWDAVSASNLLSSIGANSAWAPCCLGSTKFLDSLIPSGEHALAGRFGEWVNGFERSVLIGLNLHWSVHTHGPEECFAWLDRLLARNVSTLFVLRPHPDDATVYERPEILDRHNLLLIDELTLLSIDWSVGRLLRAVDGVITSFSTLLIDSYAAGKPVVLLPYNASETQDASIYSTISLPLKDGLQSVPVLSQDDWETGALPDTLFDNVVPQIDPDWFAPSRQSLQNLARVEMPDGLSEDAARMALAEAWLSVAAHLDFDTNPHGDRTRLIQAIERFVNAPR